MKNNTVAMLGASVVGVLAAIGMSRGMHSSSIDNTGVATVEIFVSVRTIDVSEPITPDKVRLEKWPIDRIPKGAGNQLSDFEGKFARQRFYQGEPIMSVKLMDDISHPAELIPPGYRVVSLPLDARRRVNDQLHRGDLVDVVAYFEQGDRFPEPTARTVLSGIRVFAIDEPNADGLGGMDDRTSTPVTISLLIHRQDTPAWTCASELGTIRLVLAGPTEINDRSDHNTASPAAESFLAWLSSQPPICAPHKPELLQTAALSSVPTLVSTPPPVVNPAPPIQQQEISFDNPLRRE